MRMSVREKMAPKAVNPVSHRAEKTMLVAAVLTVDRAGIFRHVRGLESGVIIEHRGVIAAVIILVGLHVKTIRKHPATVAEHDVEEIASGTAPAPGLKLPCQMRRRSEEGPV